MAHLEEKTISSEQKFDGRIVKLTLTRRNWRTER